jgi:hypothetical protein
VNRSAFFFLLVLLGFRVLPCAATPVEWGPTGAVSSTGLLDDTRIPQTTGTTPIRYTNINGEGYDIVVTTQSLGADGPADFDGDDGWWFQGTGYNNSSWSVLTFRFYVTGTTIPIGIAGNDILLEDAEDQERFGNFSYWDEFGNQNAVLFDNAIFSYSNGGEFFAGDTEAVNDSAQEGGTQDGKTIGINLVPTTISGFTIQAHRQTTSAGSVIMMGLGDLSVPPIVQWREQYFGLNLATETVAGDTANPAGDGIPNLLKYAFGLNPTQRETTGLPVVADVGGYLEVTFNMPVTDTDITYIVETSDDLVNWTEGSTYSGSGDIPDQGDTYEVSNSTSNGVTTIVVSDSVALSTVPARFMRVVVTHP